MTICARSVKIQSYIFEQSKAFLASWDISAHFTVPLLASIHLQPKAILNAKGTHGDVLYISPSCLTKSAPIIQLHMHCFCRNRDPSRVLPLHLHSALI